MADNPFAQYAPQQNPFSQYATTPEPEKTSRFMPRAPEAPETMRVIESAPYEMLGGTADLLLNAPYNIMNLGKMGFGTLATLVGRRDLAPEPSSITTPDYATNALRRLGLIKAEQNRTPEQRVLSSIVQAGTGGLMTPSRTLPELSSVVLKNMLGGAAGQTVAETTGSPELGVAAGMATPAGITAAAQRRQTTLQAAQQQNAVRDATIRQAQQEGFVVSPGSISPSSQNVLLERIGGKTRLEQAASSSNQQTTDRLARRAVGLPENQPITSEAMQRIRADEFNTGYAPLQNLGQMPTDNIFQNTLNQIDQRYTGAGRSFPGAVPDVVAQTIAPYRVGAFNSADALQATRTLRQQATANFRSGNNDLAHAQRQISNALEDQIERNLIGNPNAQAMLDQFRASRQRMAISHVVEDAVREGSGSIDAKKLARDLQRGDYLTGDLQTIGAFANVAPRVNQPPSQFGAPGTGTMLGRGMTGMVGAGLGAMTGGPITAALGAVVPEATSAAARAYLLSRMGQSRALPNYNRADFLAQDTLTPGLRNALMGLPIVNQLGQ
jgi:hypothetical protein